VARAGFDVGISGLEVAMRSVPAMDTEELAKSEVHPAVAMLAVEARF
jgi:hypothetical protein